MGAALRLRRVPAGLAVGVLAIGVLAGCHASGGAPLQLGNDAVGAITAVTTTGTRTPIDAAPSPDGSLIYFTAISSPATSATSSATSGPGPAVMKAPAAGGAATIVAAGAPLVDPIGVAVTTDGRRVLVADAGADAGAGEIISLPADGGAATVVAGSEGHAPRGLDVASVNGHDVIYFTGRDPVNARPAVFELPATSATATGATVTSAVATGATATVLAEGAPLSSPDAVVATSAGVLYVTDHGAGANGGAVFRVSGSKVTKIATVDLGNPGGVTVTKDDKVLLVSSQNPVTGADQVLTIDLASGRSGVVSKVVGANVNNSGGLHRAYDTARFAWADVSRSGPIYRIDP